MPNGPAKELRDTIKTAGAAGVRAVLAQANTPAALVRTVADDLGVEVGTLQTVETLTAEQRTAGTTYISAQYENRAALRTGLGCSPG